MSSEIISYEPATGVEFWRGPVAPLEAALAHAREAWPSWAAQPLSTRVGLIRRFIQDMRQQTDTLATWLARESGRPMWDARDEINMAINRAEGAIRAHSERASQRRLDNGMAGHLAIRHKPHGVIAVISPYSQPVLAAVHHIIPALLGGNTVVFKPSSKVPAAGAALVNTLHQAGVPTAVMQCVIGDAAMGDALARSDWVDGVAFSGSVQTGLAINHRLAHRPDKLLTLDMGGNNPLVIWDTPLIEEAALLAVQSAFAGAGQRSTTARRLIISARLYEPLIAAIKRLTDRIVIGAPFDDPAPFMGPVIDNEAADGLTQSFLWLISHGGRPISHMLRPHEGLPFLSPAIVDVTDMTERPDVELFGPLLQVCQVESFDAAIQAANHTRYGLAAGLIGGSPEDYNRFWANIRAGIITWNRPTITDVTTAPIGGVGLSGNHRPGGAYAADYCVYPVASSELEQPRASIGTGFSSGG